ncbi:MAG: PfkB family carbohydrate kinase, partial [Candidatus Levybacteria bacterium]|nr:PfkB family carbohydrate kinase [Candidatus Levybacteria bacterium]
MIIVTGSIAYDYIMDFPDSFGKHILPDQIHKINVSFLVNKFARRRGGTAGNLSYSLGLLETPHILFGVAGKDFQEYAKAFNDLKISLKNVVIDKTEYTSTGFGMTDKNNNQIWGYFPGALNKTKNLRIKKVAKKKDMVHIGPCGVAGTVSLIRQCVKSKIPYILDLGFTATQLSTKDLELGIKNAKYLIGNDYEITFAKKKIKNWIDIVKDKIIVTTLGNKGALIETPKESYRIPIAKPKAIVDPS